MEILKCCIQWGLEFGTFEYRIHSKTERFTIRKPNIQNGCISLDHFRKKLFFVKRSRLHTATAIQKPNKMAAVRFLNGQKKWPH